MPAQPPLAFIYDRHVTTAEAILDIRLQDCRAYVTRQGWDTAGEWLDRGTDALTNDRRPLFDDLCWAVERATAAGRRAVLLVQDWDRLSRDEQARAGFVRRIQLGGGWSETVQGETAAGDTTTPRTRFTHAPVQ